LHDIKDAGDLNGVYYPECGGCKGQRSYQTAIFSQDLDLLKLRQTPINDAHHPEQEPAIDDVNAQVCPFKRRGVFHASRKVMIQCKAEHGDRPLEGADPGVTILSGDIGEAVATALDAAGGKNLEILGADVASQALRRGLVDEILVYLLPVVLGAILRRRSSSSMPRRPIPREFASTSPGRFF